MGKLVPNNKIIAFLLTGIFFIVFFLLCRPVYNTDVDIYFLYTLSGGYGNEPSALLHYSYGAHPLLSSVVAFLFRTFPGFNWYSFALVIFHFICCASLLLSLLRYCKRPAAFLAFSIFFVFIETRLLLGLNYSGAALTGAICGSTSLLLYLATKKTGGKIISKSFFFFSFLVLIGGLIRLHYFILFGVFILWIGVLILPQFQFRNFLKVYIFLGLLLLAFFQGQKYYYQYKIPGWNKEEKTRHALFSVSNHPRKLPTTKFDSLENLEQQLIRNSFYYDQNLVNHESLKKFRKENARVFNFSPGSFPSFFWLFMDLRVYLLLVGGVLLCLLLDRRFHLVKKFIYMAGLPLLVFTGICLFAKSTEVIQLTVLASFLLAAFLCTKDIQFGKRSLPVGIVILLFSCTWMSVRLFKKNGQNIIKMQKDRTVINEINNQPGILFVNADKTLNFHLSVWDLPRQFPLRNIIYNELLLAGSYQAVLARFGIGDLMKELPQKKNIYVIGGNILLMESYYSILYNMPVRVEKIDGFSYFTAYRIVPETIH